LATAKGLTAPRRRRQEVQRRAGRAEAERRGANQEGQGRRGSRRRYARGKVERSGNVEDRDRHLQLGFKRSGQGRAGRQGRADQRPLGRLQPVLTLEVQDRPRRLLGQTLDRRLCAVFPIGGGGLQQAHAEARTVDLDKSGGATAGLDQQHPLWRASAPGRAQSQRRRQHVLHDEPDLGRRRGQRLKVGQLGGRQQQVDLRAAFAGNRRVPRHLRDGKGNVLRDLESHDLGALGRGDARRRQMLHQQDVRRQHERHGTGHARLRGERAQGRGGVGEP
jgi:hypothetical protein